jgi:outer membrane protein assembly factor BamA
VDPLDGAMIRRVEIAGLESIAEARVRQLLKSSEGEVYQRAIVEEDVRELLKSRWFLTAIASTFVEENQAVVRFEVRERPRVQSIEIIGNDRIDTKDFTALLPAVGESLDRFTVIRAREDILQKYRDRGYLYATVEIDEGALDNEDRVVLRVSEGPRVRVRNIRYEGVRRYSDGTLQSKIQTQTWFPIFRAGALDETKVQADALAIQQFYRDEGYLDARAGYRIEFDEVNRRDVTLVFVVEEGTRYRVREITFDGNTIFESDRLGRGFELKPKKFARSQPLKDDRQRVADRYGELGYIDAIIEARYDYTDDPDEVIARFLVVENEPSTFGRITVRGNTFTNDEVIRRELRFYPGEEYNSVKVAKAEKRLMERGIFSKATVTPLPRGPDGVREALVEIEERDAGNILFGAGVSSDSGLIGSITLENNNFALFKWPRSPIWRIGDWIGEITRGRAFQGDGQRFRIQFEPGTELIRFRIDYADPYLFDLPVRYDTSFYLFERNRGPYLERRIGTLQGLSKRFESGLLENWAVEGTFRIEGVGIDDVDPLAARPIRDVRGQSFLTTFKGSIVHDTTDSRFFPTEGYRFIMSWEQAGALGGEYCFGKPTAGFTWYKTLAKDQFGRKSVLALRMDTGYIVGDAPVFERFYAGGFGSLRGFRYRGISPTRGIKNDRVGGDFLLLAGGEYSFPLYADIIRGVTFLDMGTVNESFGIGTWRASVGFGLRIKVDYLGGVPIVLDFGFPVSSDEDDDTEVFNFSVGASF